jgi:hypothetical protein
MIGAISGTIPIYYSSGIFLQTSNASVSLQKNFGRVISNIDLIWF